MSNDPFTKVEEILSLTFDFKMILKISFVCNAKLIRQYLCHWCVMMNQNIFMSRDNVMHLVSPIHRIST